MEHAYTFPVSSGLLTPVHMAKMGDRLWCFLWCVNRTTEDVTVNGEARGKVLGGHIVEPERIAEELGLSEDEARRHLEELAQKGYLLLERLHGGYSIEVRRSIKWRRFKKAERSNEPKPMKSLVEGLKEKLAEREAEGLS